jgi:hypothetical protein
LVVLEEQKKGGHFITTEARGDVQTAGAQFDDVVARAGGGRGRLCEKLHRPPLVRHRVRRELRELDLTSPGAKA